MRTGMGRATRLLLVLAGVALLAAFLTRGVVPARPPKVSQAPPSPRAAPSGVVSPHDASRESLPVPSRNPFRYGEEAKPLARLPPRSAAPSAIAPPTPSPIRVVGLVQREGRVRAVLVLSGEVHVVGSGEQLGGYAVLAIEDEGVVRVRTPDGREIVLHLEP